MKKKKYVAVDVPDPKEIRGFAGMYDIRPRLLNTCQDWRVLKEDTKLPLRVFPKFGEEVITFQILPSVFPGTEDFEPVRFSTRVMDYSNWIVALPLRVSIFAYHFWDPVQWRTEGIARQHRPWGVVWDYQKYRHSQYGEDSPKPTDRAYYFRVRWEDGTIGLLLTLQLLGKCLIRLVDQYPQLVEKGHPISLKGTGVFKLHLGINSPPLPPAEDLKPDIYDMLRVPSVEEEVQWLLEDGVDLQLLRDAWHDWPEYTKYLPEEGK